MGEVIPFRRPPSKSKEDAEMAAFLKLLEIIAKSVKIKWERPRFMRGFLLLFTDEFLHSAKAVSAVA
jgi:hypothetical protein